MYNAIPLGVEVESVRRGELPNGYSTNVAW